MISCVVWAITHLIKYIVLIFFLLCFWALSTSFSSFLKIFVFNQISPLSSLATVLWQYTFIGHSTGTSFCLFPWVQDHSCVLNSIVGWDSIVGKWARVEGTPSDPNPNDPYAKIDSETLFRDGGLTPSITILGKWNSQRRKNREWRTVWNRVHFWMLCPKTNSWLFTFESSAWHKDLFCYCQKYSKKKLTSASCFRLWVTVRFLK